MATIVAAAGGGNWNATGTWTGGVIPTAADDVQLASTSGSVSIPAAVTALCRSLSCTGYTNTLTFAATTSVLTIGNATGGALTLSSTMTLLLTGIGTINFVSTSSNGGTGWSITTAGKTLPNVTFNGVGGKWAQADAMLFSGAVTHTAGSYSTAGFAVTGVSITIPTAANARTIDISNSTITLSGSGSAWSNLSTLAQLTLTTTNSTIILSGDSGFRSDANFVYNNASITSLTTNAARNTNGGTFNNFTMTGPANKLGLAFFGGNITVTGTLTITGNSTTNRVLVASASGVAQSPGATRTITAAAVAFTNCDFTDITIAGAAAPVTGTGLGDATGNSGINFPAGVTRYGVVAGNWSSTAMWSTTSGGAGGASVPLPQDTVRLDANSAAGNYFCDMPRLGKDLDCTGFTRTLQHNGITMYGSMTLSTAMAVNFGGGFVLAGRGTHTLTTAGKAMTPANHTVGAGGSAGGTYTMQDAWSGASTFTIQCGFSTGGFALTINFGVIAGTATRTVDFATSTVSLNGNWTYNSVVGLTLLASLATFALSVASSTARTFNGGGYAYGTLTYTVANSPGGLTITGANSFVTLNVGSGRTLTLPSGVTNTVSNWNVAGQNNGYVYLPGGAGNYMSTPDAAALHITGDIDLRVRVAMDDWTPASFQAFMARWTLASFQEAYSFGVNTTGTFSFSYSTDGNVARTANSTVNPALTDGTAYWVRATRRQSDGRVQFFTASGAIANPVDTDFTQVGADVILNATEAMFASSAILCVGAQNVGATVPAVGKFYRAQVRSGITTASTVVFDADFTTKTFGANTFVESSSQAATVTLNGTAPVGDGRVSLNSSTGGTAATVSKSSGSVISGYLKIQDSTASGGATWYAGATSTSVSNNTGWLFTDMAVGAQTGAQWPVRATAGQQIQAVHPVQTAVGAQQQALWRVQTAVAALRQALWSVRARSGSQRALAWPVRAAVSLQRASVWPVRTGVGSQRQTLSPVRARVGAQKAAVWPVRTPVAQQRTDVWPVRASVSSQRSAPWSLRRSVAQECLALYAVRTRVGSQRAAAWPTRTAIGSQRAAAWPARTAVGSQRSALWSLTSSIAQQCQALYAIRARIGVQRATAWPTRMAVSRSIAAKWPVRASVGAQRSVSWTTGAIVGIGRDLVVRWPVAAHVASQVTSLWPQRRSVGKVVTAPWAAHGLVSTQAQARWSTYATTAAQRDVRWGTRRLVRCDLSTRHPVRARVGSQVEARWRVRFGPSRDLEISAGPPGLGWTFGAPYSRRQVAGPANDRAVSAPKL